jgi:hypothetical protein
MSMHAARAENDAAGRVLPRHLAWSRRMRDLP